MNIKIITDSAADLPEEEVRKLEIRVIPLSVVQGETILKDGVDIHPDEIYARQRQGESFTTSQISYTEFTEVFEGYAKEGRPFLYISFSSGISGTYQTSCLALSDLKEKYPEMVGECIDSKSVLGGLGMVLEKVAPIALEGANMAQLTEAVEKYSKAVRHIFTVTDLNYLYKGGRLSKSSAVMGNMLKINPVLIVNADGGLEVLAKARGERKVIQRMIDYVKENGGDTAGEEFVIITCDNPEYAEKLKETVEKKFDPKNVTILPAAPIIGTHLGPGAITLHFFNQDQLKD